RAAEAMGLQDSSSCVIGRAWKVVECERDNRRFVPHLDRVAEQRRKCKSPTLTDHPSWKTAKPHIYSVAIQKAAAQELETQHFVDLGRMVRFTADMFGHNLLDCLFADVPAAERPRIEERLLDVLRKLITIPNAEVRVLVPAQKKPFRAK